MINAIMAMDNAGGVGKNGTLPWPHIKRDFQWFKNNTQGHVVVMGSKTWHDPDMPKPMPNRVNVVITTKPELCPEADEFITGDIRQGILDLEAKYPGLKIWVIGGVRVIHEIQDLLDNFYLSIVPGVYECDRFLEYEAIFSDDDLNFGITYREQHDDVVFEIWSRKRETVS